MRKRPDESIDAFIHRCEQPVLQRKELLDAIEATASHLTANGGELDLKLAEAFYYLAVVIEEQSQ